MELHTFVMKSWRIMEVTAFLAAHNPRASITGGQWSGGEASSKEEDPRLSVASTEVLETMTGRVKECASQFGRLEEIVDG